MKRGWPLVLAATIAGCGLLDATPVDPRLDPGKGPFRELGAVEVCLGKARVNGRGPTGVCGATAPRACDDDAGCTAAERCICGRCAVEACLAPGDCGTGRTCRTGMCVAACGEDAACGPGEVCAGGGCARSCAASETCGNGGTCDPVDHTCIASVCSGGATCAAGPCDVEATSTTVHEPDLVALPAGRVAYVEVRGSALDRAVYRGTWKGTARINLADAPVFEASSAGGIGIGAPSALVDDGAVVALYAEMADGTGIARLAANDPLGLTFAPPKLVLAPGEAWEDGRVASPSIVRAGSALVLVYEAGQGEALGLAMLDARGTTVSSRVRLVDASDIAPAPGSATTGIGSPAAVATGDAVFVYFATSGLAAADATDGGACDAGVADAGCTGVPSGAIGFLSGSDFGHLDLAAAMLVAPTGSPAGEPAALATGAATTLLYVTSDGSRTGVDATSDP